MERKQRNAFITARKGFCYLTVKSFGRNHGMMRIRNYQIDAEEKRHMRKLYADVTFDWKKITQQLAEKREACRRYRSRRRNSKSTSNFRDIEPFYGVYEPSTRTIYTNGAPSTAAGMGALLDAVLKMDRSLQAAPPPPEPVRGQARELTLVKNDSHSKR